VIEENVVDWWCIMEVEVMVEVELVNLMWLFFELSKWMFDDVFVMVDLGLFVNWYVC